MAEIARVELAKVPEGALVKLHHPPFHVLVANVGGTLFALENACPHSGQPLHVGALEGHLVSCSAHGWLIDVRDGTVQTEAGGGESNPTYRVTVSDGWIVVHDD